MQYERSQKLGEGISAFVFLGTFNREKVAVKRIGQRYDSNKEEQNVIKREEEAMMKFKHPNVLQLIHVEEDVDFKYLVLELCLGTVRDYVIGKYEGQMPTELDALKQMAEGLDYIHSEGFVHRDIKPANVLISQSFTLKISDFGCSRRVTGSGSFSTTSGPKGTIIYYSPEFIKLDEISEEERKKFRANVMVDIFSLGCLFFTYLTKGGHPFVDPAHRVTQSEAIKNIKENRKFLLNRLTPADHYALEIINEMTQNNPEDRMKLNKVIEILGKVNL